MDGMGSASIWHPPTISVSNPPNVVATGKPQERVEYCPNFFRSAKWCPDGACALGQCEDRTLQMLQLPGEVLENSISYLKATPVFQQPAPILDFAWYPGASSANPALYCFLASVRECPVKLLDASTAGRLRASYKIVDHRERQVAPHSLAFNCVATHLYCGYEDAIEVFDFQRPGEGTKVPTTPSKKSRDGMKGIVSSIAFCPDYSGLYAASSLSSGITLLSESTDSDPIAYLDGMTGPITQVKFDPVRPYYLYAAQRRSDDLLCWDVREPLEVLRCFSRPGSGTNQKLLFDIDPAGHWLAAGDEDGYISMFDLLAQTNEPSVKFKAHDDSIGSVAFNPIDATLLSVSGSRHFDDIVPDTIHSSDSSESDVSVEDVDEDEQDRNTRFIQRRREPIRPRVNDSSVKVWRFGANAEVTQVDASEPESVNY